MAVRRGITDQFKRGPQPQSSLATGVAFMPLIMQMRDVDMLAIAKFISTILLTSVTRLKPILYSFL